MLPVNAKTPKYCGHYKYFFLVITTIALTLMNTEKGFHSLLKIVRQGIELRTYSI